MRNLALIIPVMLFASIALVSCQPKGDATKANEAVPRNGGRVAAVSTLPADGSVATPSNQLAAGDQGATNR